MAACAALAVAGLAATPQDLTRNEAASMDKKITFIVERGAVAPPKVAKPVRTAFTEREVNAWFKFFGPEQLPQGVVNPQVAIAENGRLEGRATVDLDAIRKSKPRALFDPANLLTGSLEIRAIGTLRASNGMGVFELQQATLGGVTIPKSLLQDVVSFYSRTPESPQGFNLDKPFDLPANIRTVELQRGVAIVVQ